MHTASTQPVALITGANRGLGKAAAESLAHDGVAVVLTYRANADEAHAVVAQLESLGRRAVALQLEAGDVGSFGAFAETLGAALQEHWGRDTFDLLVNNAGAGVFAPFAQTTEEQFDLMVGVHLKGVYFLTQTLLPLLADGGSIINLSSGLARFSNAGFSAYAAAKGGVEVLTRYLAQELGARGITVNTLAPGAINTDFGGGMVRDSEQAQEHIASITALGRVGEPADIGDAIAGLFASRSRWITGQRIEASGGTSI